MTGIPVFIALLTGLGYHLNGLSHSMIQQCCSGKKRNIANVLFILISGTVLFIMLPSVLLYYMEEWDLGNAVYFMVTSLTTVGFGDLIPGKIYNVHNYSVWPYKVVIIVTNSVASKTINRKIKVM